MRRILLTFFSGLLTMLLCQSPVLGQYIGFRLDEGKKYATVPFEMHNNLIIIPVLVNNILPLKFIVDTGVRSAILIDKDYTDVLNVNYTRKITLMGVGGESTVEAFVANNIHLRIKEASSAGQSLLVLESDLLNLPNHLGVNAHGIIGYDIFSRFVVEIDYIKKIIKLWDPRYFKPRRSFQSIDLHIQDTKPFIYTHVYLNDSVSLEAKLLMDTGASHALVLFEDSDERITLPPQNIPAKLGRGLSGEINGHLARIQKIDLASYDLKNVIGSFPDDKSYGDSLKVVPRHGTLGGETMSKFTMIFDYGNEKIYLKKNSRFERSFEYNMSGIHLIATGDDLKTFKVYSIRQDSPAKEADIRVGDVLKGINRTYGDDLNLAIIYNYLSMKPGKKVLLNIQRGDEKLKKKIILRRAI